MSKPETPCSMTPAFAGITNLQQVLLTKQCARVCYCSAKAKGSIACSPNLPTRRISHAPASLDRRVRRRGSSEFTAVRRRGSPLSLAVVILDEQSDDAAVKATATWRGTLPRAPALTLRSVTNYTARTRVLGHASRGSRVPVTHLKTSSARQCNTLEDLWFLQRSGNCYWE